MIDNLGNSFCRSVAVVVSGVVIVVFVFQFVGQVK